MTIHTEKSLKDNKIFNWFYDKLNIVVDDKNDYIISKKMNLNYHFIQNICKMIGIDEIPSTNPAILHDCNDVTFAIKGTQWKGNNNYFIQIRDNPQL